MAVPAFTTNAADANAVVGLAIPATPQKLNRPVDLDCILTVPSAPDVGVPVNKLKLLTAPDVVTLPVKIFIAPTALGLFIVEILKSGAELRVNELAAKKLSCPAALKEVIENDPALKSKAPVPFVCI